MGKHASPLLVAELAVATGAKILTGVDGVAGVTGFVVVVVGAVVEVWPEAAVEPPVAIALGAALFEELLEPQPLSTNTKHAI